MKSKKGTVAAIAVIIVLVGIVCIGLLRDFDAQGYVRAILNQRFLGICHRGGRDSGGYVKEGIAETV